MRKEKFSILESYDSQNPMNMSIFETTPGKLFRTTSLRFEAKVIQTLISDGIDPSQKMVILGVGSGAMKYKDLGNFSGR